MTGEVHEISNPDRWGLLTGVLEEAVRALGQGFERVLGVGQSIDGLHQYFVQLFGPGRAKAMDLAAFFRLVKSVTGKTLDGL